MTIHATPSKLHWNYFVALERDLEALSRYIEFHPANLNVFSIELAHLLFAAASEVDVVAKAVCGYVAHGVNVRNIDNYRDVLLPALPTLPAEEVRIPRYGLSFKPWINWGQAAPTNPDWWRSYNNVKHQRNDFFHEATLQHAFNALGALLIMTFHLETLTRRAAGLDASPKAVTGSMRPESTLLGLDSGYYHSIVVI